MHTIGWRWIGQQGMVGDLFHIHRVIPESELVEMAKQDEVDERCLCCRPLQEKLFAELR